MEMPVLNTPSPALFDLPQASIFANRFADAEDPTKIPHEFTLAALYGGDCDHPCPPEVAERWTPLNRRWITFTGVRSSSIADFEPGTEVYHDSWRLHVWAMVRQQKKLGQSFIYSSLSNVARAQMAVGNAAHLWWLATENTGWLTAQQLSEKLIEEFGVTVHPDQIWAQQLIQPNLPFDESQLFRAWRASE